MVSNFVFAGTLEWSDGSVVNYVDFLDGEPDGMGSCIEMDVLNDGQWKSDDCTDNSPFFCQLPVGESPFVFYEYSSGRATQMLHFK